MLGIDISHHNGWPFDKVTAEAYEQCDFVIVKATQWESRYKWEGYFAPAIDKSIKDGKLVGAYHYATGLDPKKEAEYFLRVVKPYIGKAILALDWEDDDNRSWGSRTWAKEFVDYVYEKTGIRCFLYTGMDGVDDCKSLADTCPLWFAGYPKDENSWVIPKFPSRYDTSPWKNYTIWQYTSGKNALDRDYFPGTRGKWAEWCKDNRNAETHTTPQHYSGTFPTIPSRGYYTLGDGYKQNPGLVMDVKRLQNLVNWINDGHIAVDGCYGPNTIAAVKLAQAELKVYPDGLFGPKTLMAAKAYKR